MTTANAPTAGETILGVEVNVSKIQAAGYSAAKVIGSKIQNDVGDDVGRVHDLIIAPKGEVSIAIMEVGGFLGIGAKWVAVPADMFEAAEGEKFVLPKVTTDELKDMPPFQYSQ